MLASTLLDAAPAPPGTGQSDVKQSNARHANHEATVFSPTLLLAEYRIHRHDRVEAVNLTHTNLFELLKDGGQDSPYVTIERARSD